MDKKKNSVITNERVKISINIPEQLLIELDECRKLSGQDRSIWITSAILERIYSIRKEKNKA